MLHGYRLSILDDEKVIEMDMVSEIYTTKLST